MSLLRQHHKKPNTIMCADFKLFCNALSRFVFVFWVFWLEPVRAMTGAASGNEAIIVAMGTSLTEGLGIAEESAFPALLEDKLRSAGLACRVINAGVSGETSSGALARVEWVMRLTPDVVIIETGANDGLRGTDPTLIRKNVAAIVQFFKARKVTVILAGMRMVGNLGENYTRRFAAVFPEVARIEEVPLIPFLLEGVAARPALNQPDGIHPNEDGHRIIAETVLPYVVKAIGDRKSGQEPTGFSAPGD